MYYAIAYAAVLLPFCVLDGGWLTIMGSLVYRPTLGNILLPHLNAPPAIAFYLAYPVGILVFATLPALKGGSISPALIYGALFGALAYATYDLTNFSTLRNWSLLITIIDIAWGATASATAAVVGYYATRTITPWLGVV